MLLDLAQSWASCSNHVQILKRVSEGVTPTFCYGIFFSYFPPSSSLLYCNITLLLIFRGVGAGCNTKEVVDRLKYLEAEIEDLELKEKELDQQKLWLQQSIKNVKEDSTNKRYPLKHAYSYKLLQQNSHEREAGTHNKKQQAVPQLIV